MNSSIEDRTRCVMTSVFDVAKDDIKDNASPGVIDSWDSLKHMSFVAALEEEFDIRLSDDEIDSMVSYSIIVATIRSYLQE